MFQHAPTRYWAWIFLRSSLLSDEHFDQEDFGDFAHWFGILGYLTVHLQVQRWEGPGLWVSCNYSVCKMELAPSWTYQTTSSLCDP